MKFAECNGEESLFKYFFSVQQYNVHRSTSVSAGDILCQILLRVVNLKSCKKLTDFMRFEFYHTIFSNDNKQSNNYRWLFDK